MKTFLKSAATGLYFKAGGEWTPDAGEALDFKSARPAIEFANRAGLTHVQLAFAFPDSRWVAKAPMEKFQLRPC
jgi:hypothetical protein